MKRIFKTIVSILIIVSILLPNLYAYGESKVRTATITTFAGNVDIMKSGSEKVFDAKKDMKLTHGDRIITGKDSWIKLDVDGDKELKVGAKTYVSLEELTYDGGEKTSVKVFKGKIWTSIRKKLGKDDEFEIRTPNAVMGARGTKFLVSYEEAIPNSDDTENKSKLTVVEGIVQAVTTATVKVKDENGNMVDKQLTIAVGVEKGEDIELVTNKIQEELQSIVDEVQAMDEDGEVNLADIKKVIESKISNKEMQAMNVKELKFEELDAFSIETIIEDLNNNQQTEETKKLISNLQDILHTVNAEEKQEEQKQEKLISQVGNATKIVYGKTGGVSTASSTGSNTASSTSQNNGSSLTLKSAKTVDTDSNGIIDEVELTFSDTIDESSINISNISIIPDNGFTIGKITNASVSLESDKVLIIHVKEEENGSKLNYNTGLTAKINIPDGAIRFKSQKYSSATNFVVSDGARPVLLKWNMNFNGDEKSIRFVFSEELFVYDGIDTTKIFVTDQNIKNPIAISQNITSSGNEAKGAFVADVVFPLPEVPNSIIGLDPLNGIYYLKLDNNAFKDAANNLGVLYSQDSLVKCDNDMTDHTKPSITGIQNAGPYLLINFSEFINPDGLILSKTGSVEFGDREVLAAKRKITLGISNLAIGDKITISNVLDLKGNMMEEETYKYDGQAWTKVETFGLVSADNLGDIGVFKVISLNFNKDVSSDFDSNQIISDGKITISEAVLGEIDFITVSENTVMLYLNTIPGSNNSGIKGNITLAEGIFSSNDDGQENAMITLPLNDKAKPSATVVDDANYNNSTTVRISFSEPMNPNTITDGTILAYGNSILAIQAIGTDNTVFEIKLISAAQKDDVIGLTTDITDSNGNALTYYTKIILNDDFHWQLGN